MGTAFTYQGRLLDDNLAADGLYNMMFKLYDDPNTFVGVQVGPPVMADAVEVVDGYFIAELDFNDDAFNGDARWLEIVIRPGYGVIDYTTLTPRQPITPAPYALYAASSGDGVSVPLELSGSTNAVGSVIKGTNTGSGYGVHGIQDASGNFGALGMSTRGVYGQSSSDVGVYGVSTNNNNYGHVGGPNYGVYGINDSSGNYGYLGSSNYGAYGEGDNGDNYGYLGSADYGVRGENSNGNYGYLASDTYGVFGYSVNSSAIYGLSRYGRGVYGEYDDNGNYGYLGGPDHGVYGNTLGGSGTSGVYGEATADGAYGGHFVVGGGGGGIGDNTTAVFGEATGTGNVLTYGGRFKTDSDGGVGVSGEATADSDGYNYGGWFKADGAKARAVYGEASAVGGSSTVYNCGGYFTAKSNYGRGVYGKYIGTNDGYGGYFEAANGYCGVYGECGGDSGYGGYFKATNTGSYGIYAEASGTLGCGVYAVGDRYGIYAESDTGKGDWAGYFNGDGYFRDNVGIGTLTPAGKLDVNGSIYQRGGVLHADYVFEPGYQLESIDEHSEFMWQQKHLPAIPKATVDETGQEIVEVGSHRKGIVEELEKAHIYIEQLHKQNKEMKKQIGEMREALNQLLITQQGEIK